MSDIEGPTLRRRRLGAELKRCREAAGLTQQDVSRHFEWHAAKVTRIETARVAVTPRDVRDLLTLYNVRDQGYREALVELARLSRERTWWTDYRDIMRPGNFVGLEAAASSMRAWEPIIVPGLLQTEAYMRALIKTGRSTDTPQQIDRRVALRLTRQSRLGGDRPLELSAIIDESVLRRVIGGEDVMAEQLQHLIDTARLPNVMLQILPFSAGEHPFLGGSAALLEFRETTHLDVVYLEGLAGDYYEEQPDEVARYRQEFERMSAKALDHRTTIKMIESLLVA
ncbi:putative DNA-binding protein [Actinoplanes missouriensis 431]|uniref:Putative DNA-binding protein n=1 Tax=Actinoplanes missouriensis (strain ATCC 14538 / DSM 43046 / CBS 188.64 / JCM 3121 / NBRC 102363 / NCIMB 12654 / NRRL B-3342 / UNCC 431) TaxID=512565 RepID=I0GZM5_ACTM4|nr:helix-turn-helix transcriptional regulator [Actinoplanes missouriensis]BAL86212.1 putative DNA-binding protein [Actinoplanes missouriensis 431]